ncbi:MAG: hypothetical protein AB7E81_20635 [Hyphomicrobiaceae bacterium]
MRQRTSLFTVAERIQGDVPWGSILDAGTGIKSVQWISGLRSSRWTAVSADADHLTSVRSAVATSMRPQDRLILGNWYDPALLSGDVYETVIADYVVGAIEGYAPYYQESFFARLRPLIGRRLFVFGVDPYIFGAGNDDTGQAVKQIGRLRDACALLAGVVPYREFPAEWVVDRLQQSGLRLIFADRFPTVYDQHWIRGQVSDCRALIARIPDPALAASLEGNAAALEGRALALCSRLGGLEHGHEYVIVAEALSG